MENFGRIGNLEGKKFAGGIVSLDGLQSINSVTMNPHNMPMAYDYRTSSLGTYSYGGHHMTHNGKYFFALSSSTITKYTLSTPYDMSTMSFSQSVTSTTFSSESNPRSIYFSNDGHWMYLGGATRDNISAWYLETAWDITTGTSMRYGNRRVYNPNQDTGYTGIHFGSNGTKMYLCGDSGDDVYQYTLSSAWDIETASYDGSYALPTTRLNPNDIFFKSDGMEMYVIDVTSDDVSAYTLSNAWIITSGVSAKSSSFDISTGFTSPQGLAFSANGDKCYIVGNSSYIRQFDLTTNWNTSTASFEGQVLLTSYDSSLTNNTGVTFDGTGYYMFVSTSNSGEPHVLFKLTTAWDVTSGLTKIDKHYNAGDSPLGSPQTDLNNPQYRIDDLQSIFFSDDYLFTVEHQSTNYEPAVQAIPVVNSGIATSVMYGDFRGKTAWDGDFNSAYPEANAMQFSEDGKYFAVLESYYDRLYFYELEYPWMLSRNLMTDRGSLNLTNVNAEPTGFWIGKDGKTIWVVGTTNDAFGMWILDEPWKSPTTLNSTTAPALPSGAFSIDNVLSYAVDTVPEYIQISSDGSKLYAGGSGTNIISQFNLNR